MCSFTKAQLLFFLGSYIAVSCVHASACSSDPCRNGGSCKDCTEDCRYGKPSTCIPCNCADVDEICDMYSGNCPISGCKDGMPEGYRWGGPGCRTGNVAYNKPASSSNVTTDRSPARAVDGNINGVMEDDSCFQGNGEPGYMIKQWWQVDLDAVHSIHNVTIYARSKFNDVFADFEIWVATDIDPYDWGICAYSPDKVSTHMTLQCNAHARYLRILNGMPKIGHEQFALCEVVVIGYKVEEMPNDCEGYTCNCLSGYAGQNCERASACSSDPCSNGGTCEDCAGDCRYGKPSTCTPCNCADVDEICDMYSGDCPISGCKEDMPEGYRWGGPGCRTGNIAYNKSTSSSTVYEDNSPARAVDGNVDRFLANGSCFRARGPSTFKRQWWQVDLGGLHSIHNVTLYNREHEKRIVDFRILVSNGSNNPYTYDWSICAFETFFLEPYKTWECNARTRYVRVYNGMLWHGSYAFSLCEVVVMGYKLEGRNVDSTDGTLRTTSVLPNYCEGYTCNCPAEYTGQRCEQEISCADFPCLNGGICTDEVQGFSCECTGNYTGKVCGQQDIPDTYMEQGGIADHNRNNSYDNNTESESSTEMDTMQMDTSTSGRAISCADFPCLNGGICTDEDQGGISCECTGNYTGKLCGQQGMIKVYIVGYHLPVYGDDSISLTCILSGAEITDVNIVWKFYPIEGNPRQISSRQFYNKQDVDSDDMGTYTCEARTEWSTAKDSIIVFPNKRSSLRKNDADDNDIVPDENSGTFEAQTDAVVGTSVGIGVLMFTIIIALIIYKKTKQRTPVSDSLATTNDVVEINPYAFDLSSKNV